MPRRLAACLALIAFALCLVMGMEAENNLSTTLLRAMKAMFVTFFVGLAIGAMAQRMLNENLSAQAKKLENEERK